MKSCNKLGGLAGERKMNEFFSHNRNRGLRDGAMELGNPLIPVAIKKLIRRGANHIFGYAFFLVPGSHLREDIPFIFEQTLKKYPGVTFEISSPMMSDPMMIDFVAKHVESALANSVRK